MISFALKYFRSKLPSIAVYAVCFAVIFIVTALYRLPATAVLYGFLLSLFVLMPYAAYKCISAYRKYIKLEILLSGRETVIGADSFSETRNIIEKEYQQIIERLAKEKMRYLGNPSVGLCWG